MKTIPCLVAILACLALFIAPAAAMTSESLDITISQDGSADIQFTYRLNWIEYISVYLRLVDPAQELKKALESNFRKPVTVTGIARGSVQHSSASTSLLR